MLFFSFDYENFLYGDSKKSYKKFSSPSYNSEEEIEDEDNSPTIILTPEILQDAELYESTSPSYIFSPSPPPPSPNHSPIASPSSKKFVYTNYTILKEKVKKRDSISSSIDQPISSSNNNILSIPQSHNYSSYITTNFSPFTPVNSTPTQYKNKIKVSKSSSSQYLSTLINFLKLNEDVIINIFNYLTMNEILLFLFSIFQYNINENQLKKYPINYIVKIKRISYLLIKYNKNYLNYLLKLNFNLNFLLIKSPYHLTLQNSFHIFFYYYFYIYTNYSSINIDNFFSFNNFFSFKKILLASSSNCNSNLLIYQDSTSNISSSSPSNSSLNSTSQTSFFHSVFNYFSSNPQGNIVPSTSPSTSSSVQSLISSNNNLISNHASSSVSSSSSIFLTYNIISEINSIKLLYNNNNLNLKFFYYSNYLLFNFLFNLPSISSSSYNIKSIKLYNNFLYSKDLLKYFFNTNYTEKRFNFFDLLIQNSSCSSSSPSIFKKNSNKNSRKHSKILYKNTLDTINKIRNSCTSLPIPTSSSISHPSSPITSDSISFSFNPSPSNSTFVTPETSPIVQKKKNLSNNIRHNKIKKVKKNEIRYKKLNKNFYNVEDLSLDIKLNYITKNKIKLNYYNNNKITNFVLKKFLFNINTKKLLKFSLLNNNNILNFSSLYYLKYFERLTSLILVNLRHINDHILSYFGEFKNLIELDLSYCEKITDDGIKNLFINETYYDNSDTEKELIETNKKENEVDDDEYYSEDEENINEDELNKRYNKTLFLKMKRLQKKRIWNNNIEKLKLKRSLNYNEIDTETDSDETGEDSENEDSDQNIKENVENNKKIYVCDIEEQVTNKFFKKERNSLTKERLSYISDEFLKSSPSFIEDNTYFDCNTFENDELNSEEFFVFNNDSDYDNELTTNYLNANFDKKNVKYYTLKKDGKNTLKNYIKKINDLYTNSNYYDKKIGRPTPSPYSAPSTSSPSEFPSSFSINNNNNNEYIVNNYKKVLNYFNDNNNNEIINLKKNLLLNNNKKLLKKKVLCNKSFLLNKNKNLKNIAKSLKILKLNNNNNLSSNIIYILINLSNLKSLELKKIKNFNINFLFYIKKFFFYSLINLSIDFNQIKNLRNLNLFNSFLYLESLNINQLKINQNFFNFNTDNYSNFFLNNRTIHSSDLYSSNTTLDENSLLTEIPSSHIFSKLTRFHFDYLTSTSLYTQLSFVLSNLTYLSIGNVYHGDLLFYSIKGLSHLKTLKLKKINNLSDFGIYFLVKYHNSLSELILEFSTVFSCSSSLQNSIIYNELLKDCEEEEAKKGKKMTKNFTSTSLIKSQSYVINYFNLQDNKLTSNGILLLKRLKTLSSFTFNIASSNSKNFILFTNSDIKKLIKNNLIYLNYFYYVNNNINKNFFDYLFNINKKLIDIEIYMPVIGRNNILDFIDIL